MFQCVREKFVAVSSQYYWVCLSAAHTEMAVIIVHEQKNTRGAKSVPAITSHEPLLYELASCTLTSQIAMHAGEVSFPNFSVLRALRVVIYGMSSHLRAIKEHTFLSHLCFFFLFFLLPFFSGDM